MSRRVHQNADESCTIEAGCPVLVADGPTFEPCGYTLEVERSAHGIYTIPPRCIHGPHQGDFTPDQIAAIKDEAEDLYDSTEPTESELEAYDARGFK